MRRDEAVERIEKICLQIEEDLTLGPYWRGYRHGLLRALALINQEETIEMGGEKAR